MKLFIRSQDIGAENLDTLTEFLKASGLDGVQLVTYKTFPSIYKYEAGDLNADKCKGIKEKLNGQIPLIGAYFNPVHSSKEKVERGVNVFKDYLKHAKEFGGLFVGSETGSFNDDKWTYHPQNRTDEALNKVIATFKELDAFASSLKDGGLVAVEGAAGHVCYDVKTLNKLKTAIDSPSLKIIFDLYNFLDSSNYKSYLDILDEGLDTFKDDILLFHMKDCIFLDGGISQVPVGTGQLDYKEILTRIKRHNKNPQLVLEGTTNPYIISATNYIKKLWGSV